MAAVRDSGVQLGFALQSRYASFAILGAIVSGLYRGNVSDRLDGQVPDEVVELANEGIGVLGVASQELPAPVATTAVTEANAAFIDAMTTGFWFSVAFLTAGIATALFLLPNRSRAGQALRVEQPVPATIEPEPRAAERELISVG